MDIIIGERGSGKTFTLIETLLLRNNPADILLVSSKKQKQNIRQMIIFNDQLKNILVKTKNIEDDFKLSLELDDFCNNKVKTFIEFTNFERSQLHNVYIDDAESFFPKGCEIMTCSFSEETTNKKVLNTLRQKDKKDILELIKAIKKGYYDNYHDMNSVSFEIGELLVKIEKELNK